MNALKIALAALPHRILTGARALTWLQWTLLLLPLGYFAGIAPRLAAHQSPDLVLVSSLFVLLICLAGPTARGNLPRLSPLTKVALGAILLLSLAVRLHDLTYNVPFIDELLNFEISSIGNAEFIASDSRIWGVLCRLAYDAGGIQGSRALNAVLGTFSVFAIFSFALHFYRLLGITRGEEFSALLAALIFSFSTPTLFTSVLATHDALALLWFITGLSLLVAGLRLQNRQTLLSAAFAIFLSFAARYFMFVLSPAIVLLTHAPLGLLNRTQRRLVERWFYLPSLSFVALYAAFDYRHMYKTISLGARLSGQISERSYMLVSSALLLFTWSVVLLLLLAPLLRRWVGARFLPEDARQRVGALFLLLSMLMLPAVQLITCSDFGSEKNLSYAVLFAALLFGLLVTPCVTAWHSQRMRLLLGSVVVVALFTLGLRFGTKVLLPRAIRSEHAVALKREIQRLEQQPILGAFSAPLRIIKQRWLSPEPVLAELTRLGLTKQRTAVFGLFGGEHINWYLTHYLGRDPKTTHYYADQSAPWVKDFFKYIRKTRPAVLVAVMPEVEAFAYERMFNLPGYQFLSRAQIDEVDGAYGRVYILVDPRLLDYSTLSLRDGHYLTALLHYVRNIPAAAATLNRTEIDKLFSAADSILEKSTDIYEQISLLLEQARARAVIGEGDLAKKSLLRLLSLGASLEKREKMRILPKQALLRMPLFRQAAAVDNYQPLGAQLLQIATPGSTADDDPVGLNTRAYWLDFDPPLEVPAGTMLRFETTLRDSKVAGIRLVEDGQDFSFRGYMEVMPFFSGRQVSYIPIVSARRLRRIDFQIGPEAWGSLGGSPIAELEIHSATVEQLTPADLYLAR